MGMTLKQWGKSTFLKRLEEYKTALAIRPIDSRAIVSTSLLIHQALGLAGVPKSYKRYVTRAYKESQIIA